ncbi:MAG: hypothetical protein COU07_02180 [Candidatus Harrisonbacteria bacterium CG10_big_fil_rev_8_21_14_0_10_40_38]|uniref:Uncharacterized protein n=1 Tax=Candidatus Harrisonbacteria bacterium CG10_big_fil_rev_8_21_14_0_10_40_38 TaxID=1974583 RepID=A0A2H0US84_9BACT|nr:MAG: hypothetical protein COU07_02180 [Candidatus Harrisonbacteria bacterium CG10_big_fil_rev_8_21_14_0_10_40_38]
MYLALPDSTGRFLQGCFASKYSRTKKLVATAFAYRAVTFSGLAFQRVPLAEQFVTNHSDKRHKTNNKKILVAVHMSHIAKFSSPYNPHQSFDK